MGASWKDKEVLQLIQQEEGIQQQLEGTKYMYEILAKDLLKYGSDKTMLSLDGCSVVI